PDLAETAGEVRGGDAGIASEGEDGGGGRGAGGASPGARRLRDAVHVERAARGVHDEGDVVPPPVVVAGCCQGASGAVPDVVGGVAEVPGAEAAAVGEDLVAVEGGGEVLVDDTVQAGSAGPHPDGDGQGQSVEGRDSGDVDVVVDAVEGEALTEPAGDPCGAAHESSVQE